MNFVSFGTLLQCKKTNKNKDEIKHAKILQIYMRRYAPDLRLQNLHTYVLSSLKQLKR